MIAIPNTIRHPHMTRKQYWEKRRQYKAALKNKHKH